MTAINNLSYPKVFGMEFSSRKVEQEGTQGQQHVILHHDITDANISLEKEDVPEEIVKIIEEEWKTVEKFANQEDQTTRIVGMKFPKEGYSK